MPNVIRIACVIASLLLMSGCQSYSTPPIPPTAVQCQPPAPAAWFMEPHAPNLTRRMLNELSVLPMPATGG
ncbi:MAG: lysis system o-spanin lipoprotein Rz1 [Pseudomonas sp.]